MFNNFIRELNASSPFEEYENFSFFEINKSFFCGFRLKLGSFYKLSNFMKLNGNWINQRFKMKLPVK